MKVLHVHNMWPVTEDLVIGLQALGVEAEIFEPTLGVGQKGKFPKVMLPFIRIREAFKLRQLVKREKFDIVHVHYARHAFLTLITGLPYYLHCHGSDVRRDLFRPGFRELTLLAIRNAIKVFYATPDLGNYLKPIRQDALFVPNPINLEDFDFWPYDCESNLRVFSISKLDRFKGVKQIIQAIELIWQNRPETEIAMFNYGSQIYDVGTFFDLHRNDRRLIQLSAIPHNQMIRMIQSSDVILGQQSQQVGAFGVSELESMACGKPVVCYFKYPYAYLNPPPVLVSQSPEEASQHVVQLLDDQELRQSLGRQGREWVATNHERNRIARKLLDYYQV